MNEEFINIKLKFIFIFLKEKNKTYFLKFKFYNTMFTDFSRAHAIRVMENLANYPCAKLFLYPVNSQQEGLYDYSLIVKRPMDITSIINNLLNGRYKSFSEWKRDIYQIYQNSKLFNGPESYITILALQLLKRFNQEFSSFFSYDPNIWKDEYQRISDKLKKMILEENQLQSSEAYQRAIEISQKGQRIFQSISENQANAGNIALKQKIVSRNQDIVKSSHSISLQSHSMQKNQTNSSMIEEFVSPPEISDESKNGLRPQNSHFRSFELSASNNGNISNGFNDQTEVQRSSMFKGIDMLNLPPQIVLSERTEKQQNVSKNNSNSNFIESFTPEPLIQNNKLPSIFGNVQLNNLPPVFDSSFNPDSIPNNFNSFISNQTLPKLNHENNFNYNTFDSNTSMQKVNNFIINDYDRNPKNVPKPIPQPILMPLPAILQTKPVSISGTPNTAFSYNSEYRNKENPSNEIKKGDSFDNSGFIDVTDYF